VRTWVKYPGNNTETTNTMPNKLADNRRRAVFIVDSSDYNELEDYANKMGFTASVMLREAVYRLAQELREKNRTILIRQPRDDEGHSTKSSG